MEEIILRAFALSVGLLCSQAIIASPTWLEFELQRLSLRTSRIESITTPDIPGTVTLRFYPIHAKQTAWGGNITLLKRWKQTPRFDLFYGLSLHHQEPLDPTLNQVIDYQNFPVQANSLSFTMQIKSAVLLGRVRIHGPHFWFINLSAGAGLAYKRITSRFQAGSSQSTYLHSNTQATYHADVALGYEVSENQQVSIGLSHDRYGALQGGTHFANPPLTNGTQIKANNIITNSLLARFTQRF